MKLRSELAAAERRITDEANKRTQEQFAHALALQRAEERALEGEAAKAEEVEVRIRRSEEAQARAERLLAVAVQHGEEAQALRMAAEGRVTALQSELSRACSSAEGKLQRSVTTDQTRSDSRHPHRLRRDGSRRNSKAHDIVPQPSSVSKPVKGSKSSDSTACAVGALVCGGSELASKAQSSKAPHQLPKSALRCIPSPSRRITLPRVPTIVI